MIKSLSAFSWKASWTLCRFYFHPDQLWFPADFSGSRGKTAKTPRMGEHSDSTSNYILFLIKKYNNPCRSEVSWDFPESQGWHLFPSTGGRIWRQSFTAHLYQPLLLLHFSTAPIWLVCSSSFQLQSWTPKTGFLIISYLAPHNSPGTRHSNTIKLLSERKLESKKQCWHAAEKQEVKESTDSLYSMRLESLAKKWNYTASWKKVWTKKAAMEWRHP